MQEDEAPHTGLTKCPGKGSRVGRTVQVFHASTLLRTQPMPHKNQAKHFSPTQVNLLRQALPLFESTKPEDKDPQLPF